MLVGAAVLGLTLHTLAALWVWRAWGQGPRGIYLVWMDLPVSLAWMDHQGHDLLTWSLVGGGTWWALVTALVTFAMGRMATR